MFGRATITLGIGPHSSFVLILLCFENQAVGMNINSSLHSKEIQRHLCSDLAGLHTHGGSTLHSVLVLLAFLSGSTQGCVGSAL